MIRIITRSLTAFRFLTIIPFPGTSRSRDVPEEFAQSMAFFPLVGVAIGAGLVFIAEGLAGRTSCFLQATALVVFWGWISGALHLEGFVDAADGFSAGPDKEKILAVMKDVHCGAKGVVAVVFLAALKIALVHDICAGGRDAALVVIPALGRWAMVYAASLCPYGGKTKGLGAAFTKEAGSSALISSTVILIIIGISLLRWNFFILMLLPVTFCSVAIVYLRKKLNGVTGDVLGALNEITELFGLASILLWKT
ncbi:MAG TPA: adenosylcobinamide-GDP ribazoletransferase [Candidatus Omnitrophota bacterium]|nr:adenosylcobinamide-GDP ribazoletransferase [Candidatus Omnitrophota bacterium]HQO57583.1 adenosylcobinamide-GDP ribazoletransferase [Candidatus Omnitrophota bacterium]